MNRRREFMFFGLRLAVGIGLLVVMFIFVDFGSVLRSIAALHPLMFFLAFLISIVASIIIPAIITNNNIRVSGIGLQLGELIGINFAMRFYVLMLPHAITVGMRWLRYRGERKGKGWQAAALIIFERVVQFLVVVFFALLFLCLSFQDLPQGFSILIPVAGLLSALGFVVFLLFVSGRVLAVFQPVVANLSRRLPYFVSSRLDRLISAVTDYQHLENRHMSAVIIWSVIAHLLFIASAYVVGLGLDLPVGFSDLGWMRSVIFLITVLPITVGGIGVREAGFAGLLYIYGVDKSLALAFPLVLLAVQLLIGLIGALLEIKRVAGKRWGGEEVGN